MSQYLLRISSWGPVAPGLFGPFVMDDEVPPRNPRTGPWKEDDLDGYIPWKVSLYTVGGARREGNHIETELGSYLKSSLHGEWFGVLISNIVVSEWNCLYLYIFTPLHPIAKSKLSHRVDKDQRFPNDSPAQISGSAGRPELFKWASPCVAAMCCRFFCCWGQVWSKHRDILKWPFALKSQRRGWNSRIHRWKSKQHVVMVTENPGKRYFL